MKPYPLPALMIGLDTLSSETSLPKGAVRVANNITIQNNGDWQRRPGFEDFLTLDGAHSLWQSAAQTRVLVAAGDTLYDVDLEGGAAAPLFVGLPFEEPVEYTDCGPDIYFTAGGVLRSIDPDGNVRRPGIMALLGERPTLTPTVGGMAAGRYGVAYAVLNERGEESPLSSVEFITLTGGGILVSGIQTAPGVTEMNVYVTTPDGDRLYRYAKLPIAASCSIVDNLAADDSRAAERLDCQPMPGGEIVRYFNGRLYVAAGKWLYISRALDYGVSSTIEGWMTFRRSITVMEPVAGGIFLGLRERTLFLRGNGPSDFQLIDAAGNHGAVPHTGVEVAADYFNPDMVPDRATPVACWLSEVGLAIGRPDGSIAYPQAGRIKMDAGPGRPLFMQQLGIKQGVFQLETLTMGIGGAVDTTI
ncbi:MAG TPA: hypothetical protein VMZ06_05450 [Candidatus Bathyarchaeia archaeon]|nr:hypothetical protein [Candidatus Bathyarchaeia archaeon]